MKANECKCCKCGKQAVAFYPCVDPDVPSFPYCPDCLGDAMVEMVKAVFPNDNGMLAIAEYKAKKIVEKYKNGNTNG